MSSFDIDLDDPPERWRELYAWLEAGEARTQPPRAAPAPPAAAAAADDPGATIALYAAYLAGEL
jgi:hypothetical protein